MLSTILKELVSKSGKSQKQIASELQLSQQRFNFYVNGTREPDTTTLSSIADYFQVSLDYLLGRTDKKSGPPADTDRETDARLRRITYAWRDLTEDGRAALLDYVDYLTASPRYIKSDPLPADRLA